ncbi:2Fe-2S iron-sulfur cluster binding domain-containing protein [Cupriavidus basilensis]|uniref:2Fe-2S iron-sulfur cluster binding domain-containing protein n=2 Tax=Cupriavidus basilensis TaxID=68895 RepID=A0A643G3N4_9BURK|nr:2Fe-2S iron-sulfur cluster binding domain-containing protein [Cupriavidus basilensis]
MPKLSYIRHDGTRTDVEVSTGATVMQSALERGVDGISGDCGGACQCCTCHVFVEEAWLNKLPPVDEMEDAMLDSTAEPRRANSRLSCMLTMAPELDGLVVHLPASQL